MKAPAFSYYMHDGSIAFSIELAGALAAEGAKKLEQDLTEIDSVGRQLLLRWRRNGATILANTPESRVLAESVIGRLLRPLARIAYTSKRYRSGSFFRDALVGLLVLLVSAAASAQPLPIVQPTTPSESIAFARYIAWVQARDPFTESGPVALAIVASLPGLEKQVGLLAIREVGKSERNQYGILELQGDAIVFERAIAPYLVAQSHAEDVPRSSVIITPRNYRFCYAGTVETEDSAAYIFRITPKKNRAGLIRGELWIEPVTGAPVLVSGYLVTAPSTSVRSINVVREITFLDGYPFARRTHVMIESRPVGRAELTIFELPLGLADPDATPPSISGEGKP